MADKSQQIKTDLIFNAQNAIDNIKELSGLLDKINGFSFNRTKQGMDSFSKAIKQASEAAVKGAEAGAKANKSQSDEEEKIQNLIKQRTELIQKMTDAYSQNSKVDLSKQITQLENLNNKVANMYVAMGQASNAVKFLKESLENLDTSNFPFKDFQKNNIAQRIADIKKLQQANDDYVKSAMGQPTSVEKAAEKQRKEQERQQKELERQQKQQEREQKRIEQEEQRSYDQRVKNLATFAKETQSEINAIEKNLSSLEKGKGLYSDAQLDKDLGNLAKISTALKAVFGKNDAQTLFGPAFDNIHNRMTNLADLSSIGENSNRIKLSEGAFEQATATGDIQKVLSDLKKKMQSAKYDGNEELYNGYLEQYKRYSAIVKQVNDDIKKLNQTKKQEADTEKTVTNTVISEEEKQQKEFQKKLKILEQLDTKYDEIKRSIANHSGPNGLAYSQAGLDNMVARIESLSKAYEKIGADNYARLLNPSMLSGVNTTIGRFNSQLADARTKAQELYMTFQRTKSEADRLRFLNAKDDFIRLNEQAEQFDRTISKTRRDALSLGNIAKRAKESFNWMVGSQVENAIAGFPFEVIGKVKDFELEMAGMEQVLPKISQGQAAANQEFQNFANIAGQYGQSVENTLTAAKSLGRMYGGTEETADIGARNTEILTAQAAKMATTDNFDMVAATQGLESALSQFNMQTEDSNLLMARSTHILDVWTKLAHTSGASAQDLTEGVKQAGASAQEAGVSFEFLNALVATGVRTTAKSGNEIGTMLKSLFASMQGDKAIKAMQDFGIEVYKVGATGKKELRPLQDLILDVSKALQTTNKDTKGISDFLLAISGGKFQVSKVAALLGNYKELKRTIEMAGDSAGFTDKQLKMQMDTISRKFETLKSNISQLFQETGSNGLVNDLKWILNILNNITEGLKHTETNTYQWGKRVVALVAAYKLIPALINQAAKAMGRAVGTWKSMKGMTLADDISNPISSRFGKLRTSFKNAEDNTIKKNSGQPVKKPEDENTSAQAKNTSARKANKAAIDAQSASITKQTADLNNNTAALSGNTSANNGAATAERAHILSTNALTRAQQHGNVILRSSRVTITGHNVTLKRMGSEYRVASVQVRKATQEAGRFRTALNQTRTALATHTAGVRQAIASTRTFRAVTAVVGVTSRIASVGVRLLSAAVWALGGPIGVAIEGLSLLAINIMSSAEEAGEAEEAYRSWREEIDNTVASAQAEAEQVDENKAKAQELAEQYNALQEELNNLTQATDNNSEASQRETEIRQQMGTISNQIQQLLHADSIQFDEDGKINKNTIEQLAAADKQKALQKIEGAQAEIQAEYDAKNALLVSTQKRMEAMNAEGQSIKNLALLYRGFKAVLAAVYEAMEIVNDAGSILFSSWAGNKLFSVFLGKSQADAIGEWFDNNTKYFRQMASEAFADATDFGKEPDEEYNGEGVIASLINEINDDENKYNELGALHYRLEYGVNPDGTPVSHDQLVDPTGFNRNADKEGTQPKSPKGKKAKNPKGRKTKAPAYQKQEWTYGDKASRVMATIVDDLNEEGWNKAGVTIPSLMVLANLINGRNGAYWDDISDLFGTGDSNMWDSGFTLKNKLIDQFQQGKTLEDAFKALAPSVPQSEWDNAFGGSSNYIQYLTDHNNFDKFKRDFTGDDPYEHVSSGSGGGYDYSVFTNPFLAEQAVIISQKIKAKTGENVNPNQIYGTLMAETPNATADNYTQYLDGSLGLALGGLEMDVADLGKWQDAMAATLTHGGYDNTPTTMDWVNALARTHFKSDANTDQTYIASNDEYSNEKGWFGNSGGGFAADAGSNDSGFDTRYVDLSYAHNSYTDIENIQESVKEKFNEFSKEIFEQTGITPMITGGAETGVHAQGEFGHEAGWKIDIHNNIPVDKLVKVADALGIAIGDEGNHFDLSFNQGGVGGTQLTSRAVGDMSVGAVKSTQSGTFKPRNRWHVGKDSLQAWTRNPIEEYVYNQENAQKDYEKQKKILEIDKKQNGITAENAIRTFANDTSSLNATQGMADLWKSIKESREKDLVKYITTNVGLGNAVKANGLTPEQFLNNLPDSEIEEMFKDAKDTSKEKDIKAFLTARKKLKESQASLSTQEANINSEWYGYISPADSIDYRLKQLEQSHKESAYGTTQSETWQIDHDYYVNRVGLLEDKLDVYSKELRKIRQAEQARLEELSNQIDELENGTVDDDGNLSGGITQLESKKDRTEDENKQLDEQKKKVEELRKQFQNLAKNHSDAYREIESKTQETNNQLEETKNKVNEIELAFREKLENGVANMFENIFLEGKTFRDSWKDLWKDIGKLAWEQLVKVNLLSNVQKWSGAIGDIFGGRRNPRTAVTSELVGTMMNAPIRADSIVGGISSSVGSHAGSRQIAALTGRAIDGTYFPMSRKIPVSSESVVDTMAGTGTPQVGDNLKDFGAQLQKSNMVWQNMATPIEQLGSTAPLLQSATVASRASVIQQIASTGVNTAAINANTAAQSTSSITGGIWPHANGGSLAKFASGGNTGLIKGAGTGTSDSILTYLAHQGRFIATSNGEYIVKKSTVDKLGTNYLDMLNNNPEAMAGLQRYADGGNLGVSYVPSMSPKTVDSYNSLNHNQAVIKMNSNKKLETLMQQQNDMISKMGSGDSNGGIVVLNTQADSASVMKALAKNPRAVQRILGGQKKHGFGR